MERGSSFPDDPPQRRRAPTLPERLIGTGARSARSLAGATGIDRAVEAATEEAIVGALESPAVERALARVLRGPVVEEAVEDALSSPAVERALVNALDSEMVDRLWERLLASDEAQKLVERIAEAPEVRSAVAAQGVGFIEDVGRQIGRAARRLDDVLERAARRLRRRPARREPTDRAGLAARGLALGLDGVILNGAFAVFSALLALVVSALSDSGGGPSTPAIVVGSGLWLAGGAIYLISFWSLTGQTPGMRFLGIRVEHAGSRGMEPRVAARRLVGLLLSILALGAGLLAILFSDRRRGWHDRLAGTEVAYVDSRRAPWAVERAASGAADVEPGAA
jgi:uncharacterized RDD family membrane protein YckC